MTEGKSAGPVFTESIWRTCFQPELIHKTATEQREFKACLPLWESRAFFSRDAGGGFILHVYFPHLFFGIWFGCFVSFITHGLLLKRNHVRACWEQTLCLTLAPTHQPAHTHSHIEQHGGCFSGALYGLRRWKHIIKVQSRSSGIYWKDFFVFC